MSGGVAARAPSVALLAVAVAAGQLATSLYLPALPAMAADLGVGPLQAGWTLTAFYVGLAACNLAAGPLADRYGRRPVMLGGMAVFVAGTLVCAAAPGIGVLLAGRVLQAAGAAAAPVVARAVVRDTAGPGGSTAAMAWLGVAMAAAPALGPPLGGAVLGALGWRGGFWLLAGAGIAIAAALGMALTETLRAPIGSGRLLHRYAGLLRDGAYVRYVAALSALFAGLGVFFATGPFLFIQRLGISPVAYGVLNLANVAGYLGGSLVAGRLARRVPPHRMVWAGTLVSLAGGIAMVGLAMAGIERAWSILLPVVTITAGFGAVLPAATAAALERHPGQAGLASAMLGFLQIAAAAAGTALAGLALGGGIVAVAWFFLALTVAAVVASAGLRAP